MATVTEPARVRKPRPKPTRSIGWIEAPEGPGQPGALEIVCGKVVDYYLCREIECQLGGRGFELEKADYTRYHVLLNDDGSGSCDCMGHERWSTCKHFDGIRALIAAGRFPLLQVETADDAAARIVAELDADVRSHYRSTADLARNNPAAYERFQSEWI